MDSSRGTPRGAERFPVALLGAGRIGSALVGNLTSAGYTVLAGDYAGEFGSDRIVEELGSLVELAADQHSPFEASTAVTTLYERALRRFGPIEGELLAIAELEAEAGRQLRAENPIPD